MPHYRPSRRVIVVIIAVVRISLDTFQGIQVGHHVRQFLRLAAAGVYDGEGPLTDLLAGPRWATLARELAPEVHIQTAFVRERLAFARELLAGIREQITIVPGSKWAVLMPGDGAKGIKTTWET